MPGSRENASSGRGTRDTVGRDRAVAAWERWSTWPFLVLSLVFIVAYSIHCLDASLTEGQHSAIWLLLFVIWAVFIVDYVARLTISPDKWRFVRRNVPDLLAAIIPIFRPFRAIKELHRVAYFRRRTAAAARARVVTYALSFVVLWLYTISISVVYAERGAHGATILNLGDALYWAVVTISTVGYGDMVPVTTFGRVLAVLLMLSGIAIVGVTTATVVSYLGDAIHTRRTPDSVGESEDETR